MVRVINGEWQEEEEMTMGWDRLMDQMKELRDDMTMESFLDRYFGEGKDKALRAWVKGYAQGFDLANINDASVFFLRDEWSREQHHQFRVDGGYAGMIKSMEKELLALKGQLRLGITVKEIKWKPKEVNVITADGSQFTAAGVLITVPIGVLQADKGQAASLKFEPAIDGLQQAVNEIGYGTVTKFLLEFSQSFLGIVQGQHRFYSQ